MFEAISGWAVGWKASGGGGGAALLQSLLLKI